MRRRESRPSPGTCCILLTILLAAGPAVAQRPSIATFDVGSGLPSAEIFDLEQDSSGRLWILSRAGLTVYDGHTFTPFESPDETHGSAVAALEVDARGRLWALTTTVSGWLVSYLQRPLGGIEGGDLKGPAWHNLPRSSFRHVGLIAALAVVPGGDHDFVAVASLRGELSVWDGGKWVRLALESAPYGQIHSMAVAGDRVFLGTSRGLHTVQAAEPDAPARFGEDRLRGEIIGVESEGEGLWLLGPRWLGTLQRNHLTVVAEGFDLDTSSGGAIVADQAGGVWFGNVKRALFLDPVDQRVRRLMRRNGLAGDGMSALLRDRESHIWIGSLRGLSEIYSQRFLSFDQDQGLLEDEVSAIIEAAPGQFILGHDTGLTFLDEGDGVRPLAFERPASGPANSFRVLDTAIDDEGTVWLAANSKGLLRLTAGEDPRSVKLPSELRIFSVEFGSDGKLWALSPKAILVRGGSGFSRVDPGIELDGAMRWLTAAPGGRLYVATAEGVLWHEAGDWRRVRGPVATADNIYQVFIEPSGEVLAGTKGGLYQLTGSELTAVRRGELAISRPVYFILRDRRRRMWFGTDDGALVWDGKRLRHLTVRHGLAGRETNRGAGYVDHRGRVWIGTDRGVSVYQEPYDVERTAAPSVEIRALEVVGRPWPMDGDVRLAHHQNTLMFHVETVTFSREEVVHYRYRLDGFDADWLGPAPLPGGEVRYTNLPPGGYRFHVSAGWPGGPWSSEAVSSTIVIVPPVWRRLWFLALVAVGLTSSIFGVFNLKTRAIRSRSQELESLNARLNEIIGDHERTQVEKERLIEDLAAKNFELERFTYTASHDLKTPLVTIRGFLGLLRKDAAAGDAEQMDRDIDQIGAAAEKMGRLLDELLELSRIGRVIQPSESVSLSDLAREAAGLAAGSIAESGAVIEIAADLPVISGDRGRLLEVLQNLIENAVKYLGEQPAPRIEVGVRDGDDGPVVFVRDNGIGIDPRYHEKVFGLFERLDHRDEGTGIGLALAKRIVEFHGGHLWVESEGLGHGSTFCFTLPSRTSPGSEA